MKNSHSDEEIEDYLMLIKSFKEGQRSYLDEEVFELVAHYYGAEEQFKQMVEVCELGLSIHTYSSALWHCYADALTFNGESEKAPKAIEKALELQPNSPAVLQTKIRYLLLVGNFAEAVDLLKDIEDRVEDKAYIYKCLGLAHDIQDNRKKAIFYWEKAIHEDPRDASVLRSLLELVKEEKYAQKLKASYNKLIDQDTHDPDLWFCLGLVLDHLSDKEATVEAFEYATYLKPDFEEAYEFLGHAFMNQSKHEKALECYQTVLAMQEVPTADICCHIGACYEELGNYTEASKQYQKALEQDKHWDYAWFGLGSCLLQQERFSESLYFFNKAIKITSNNPIFWIALAKAEGSMGNFHSANEAYEQACLIAADRPELWLEWSELFQDQELWEEAISIIERGIDEVGESPELLYRLVAYCFKGGNYQEGIVQLQVALAANYEKHTLLYEYFTDLETQKTLYTLIERLK
ncbi:MAG: tetratricopeptide repeat protein [Cytophagales bacterium]|nr:MAG: tetratricopeptide repeat protein [Cytophagales bacterium]TAF61883.1 MAG: tetratricopeptide repeat protein [Cytophagales bacterium]